MIVRKKRVKLKRKKRVKLKMKKREKATLPSLRRIQKIH